MLYLLLALNLFNLIIPHKGKLELTFFSLYQNNYYYFSISVYYNALACSFQSVYIDCFVDLGDNSNRDLSFGFQLGSNTIESCNNYCEAKAYKYAGVQNGSVLNYLIFCLADKFQIICLHLQRSMLVWKHLQ